MDINEATAKAISAERAIAGITIRDLASKADIPLTSLQRVLSAEREIKINQIARIATALDVYPHDIVEHAEKILERDQRTGNVIKLPARPLPIGADGFPDYSDMSEEDVKNYGLAAKEADEHIGFDEIPNQP